MLTQKSLKYKNSINLLKNILNWKGNKFLLAKSNFEKRHLNIWNLRRKYGDVNKIGHSCFIFRIFKFI